MYDLSDRNVLVTGSSKGIGAAIARKLGAAGASVVAHYGADRAGAMQATRSIADANKLLLQADFAALDEVEALWDRAIEWRGKIDVFVNNAAVMCWDGGFEQPLDAWDQAWEASLRINVLAAARSLRRAVLHFSEVGGGTIVTLSSWAAQKGVTNPDTIAYGSSKAAIHNATQTIARAFARQGVLAYLIAPGVVRTRLSEQFAETQGGEERITDALTMGEWVPPDEIAELVAFLATGRVRHLSGATLDVNGASYVR
jgi:NAD(P)-dependent dehydrogenase (short-subunit alcohol dehydrogenase family)